MPNTEATAARHARDRNLFTHDAAPGPYDAAYDVRRGYDEPLAAPAAPAVRRERTEVLQFRARDEERRSG